MSDLKYKTDSLDEFTLHEDIGLDPPIETEKLSQKRPKWQQGFINLFYWYPEDLSQEERKLLVKTDVFLLIYVCASYFTKSLDKSNITNAYVSGMKEDIVFDGNDLAYAKSLYSAGYIVSMCLGTMFVTRPWARLMLPTLECIWGILTFCECAAKTSSHMFAMRFLIGLAEGPIFPSIVYILGSWYKRNEIYRRIMAFSMSSSLGGMFSGYLQAAAYNHLTGHGGLSGWQWGFIIDGIITVPVALFGFLMFPGTPSQAQHGWSVLWLSPQDVELAQTRMIRAGVAAPKPMKLSFSVFKRVALNWHVHFFATFWVLLNIVALPDGLGFPLWLKSKSPESFTIAQVNNYPTIQPAVGIVAQFVAAGLSDTFPVYPFLTITQALFIISYSSLAAWNIPDGWRWVCFLIIGLDMVDQSLVSGWINHVCRGDAEERAFVLGYSDAVSQAINIWTNIVFYPTVKAPEFHLGYIVSTVAAILMLFLPILAWYGERWDAKSQQTELDGISASPTSSGNSK